jgi:hypothetical protein
MGLQRAPSILAGVEDTDDRPAEPSCSGWPDWAREVAEASPDADELRHIPWRNMLPPPIKPTKRTQAYIDWMRLTHNGRRTPLNPVCSECEDPMTEAEVAEYRAGRTPQS